MKKNHPAPRNLVIEIPSAGGDCCANACRHCIHRGLKAESRVPLSHPEILGIIQQGGTMGIPTLILYPHQSDVTLENPDEFVACAEAARCGGMQVKTVTAGTRPDILARLLPRIDRLAVSVDAVKPGSYGSLRSASGFAPLMATLDLLRRHRKEGGRIYLSALVMVDRGTIGSIEERVESIHRLDLFNKIKVLELLPIGAAEELRDQALAEGTQINRLVRLRKVLDGAQTRVGVPLWRIRRSGRGCRLGEKDLVVGPGGELAGCTLMLYQNEIVGNVRDRSLADSWETSFQVFRQKPSVGLSALCLECAFYRRDRCWGGCPARARIFGAENEIHRSCQIGTPDESERLYRELCGPWEEADVNGCGLEVEDVVFREG